MKKYTLKAQNIVEFKDWSSLHLKLLKKDKMAAFMHCCCTKLEDTIILCNINSIPNGYTINDVVNIIEGKHIKL